MSRNKNRLIVLAVVSGLALLLGLVFGWLVVGWQLWPVKWTSVLPVDLRSEDREQYLDLVAESFTLNKDVKLARQRLASFPPGEQEALLADVKTRVARRLEHTENILVLGADQRPGWEAWRTDSIMVVAIDPKGEQVGIISIPRDLYVDIPTYGKERINSVDYIGEKTKYPGGGPALAARVISDTLGIPTQHYARIQMDGLARLIDTLGGVTVTLDCPLYERTPNDSSPTGYVEWTLPAGQVHLNGDAARKFATYRYVTSDFGRTQRQQQLIWAIRNRALQANVIPRIPELWKAFSDLFTTDLSLVDVIRLANVGIKLKPSSVHGLVFNRAAVKDYTTERGEMVLVIGDKAELEAEKEQLFFRKPLEQLGRGEAGKDIQCPPPPKP
jgi:polyisoprenyl-teichoic acid--peptidoglycan teichoic acid transferase